MELRSGGAPARTRVQTHMCSHVSLGAVTCRHTLHPNAAWNFPLLLLPGSFLLLLCCRRNVHVFACPPPLLCCFCGVLLLFWCVWFILPLLLTAHDLLVPFLCASPSSEGPDDASSSSVFLWLTFRGAEVCVTRTQTHKLHFGPVQSCTNTEAAGPGRDPSLTDTPFFYFISDLF